MLSSSPRPDRTKPRGAGGFHGAPLVAPSSPSAAYQDGEISPSFDASFASSMSITSDERSNPSPRVDRAVPARSSPAVAMDISPAPAQLGGAHDADRLLSAPIRAPPNLRPVALFTHANSYNGPSTSDAATSKSDHPFLKSLFRSQQSAPATQTSFPPIAPLSVKRSSSPVETSAPLAVPFPSSSTTTSTRSRTSKPRSRPSSGSGHSRRPSLPHYATVPPSQVEKAQPPYSTAGFDSDTDENAAPRDCLFGAPRIEETLVPPRYPAYSRSRSALPTAWNGSARPGAGGLAPPVPPVKRRSESSVPQTRKEMVETSPFRMEIDGSSPGGLASPIALRSVPHPRSVSDTQAQASYGSPTTDSSPSNGAADGLAAYFNSPDLSPIPASRKRFLEQEASPTPASPTPSCGSASASLGALGGRRAFDKIHTIGPGGHVARRQRSAVGLNLSRRPSLASFGNASVNTSTTSVNSIPSENGSTSSTSSFNKRLASQAQDGKPAHSRRNVRRALSVADAVDAGCLQAVPNSPAILGVRLAERDLNVPMESPQPAPIVPDGSDYFAGKRVDLGPAVAACLSPESGSPIAGFRQQEARGKALPCFNVKEDGLMRITPDTLNALQAGHYADKNIKSYHVIDCRFDYEYAGGHIANAINLSEMADVENALLNIDDPPMPSTSERPLTEGRTVLIFHCEFSAKRAPTCAKHLRNVDRVRNCASYPKVHYPEVYVLQGGYEAFYRAYPNRCVGGYVVMDHPEHDAKRSVHLDKFRKQKGVFNRASSFTFGQAQHASALLRNAEGGARRPLSLNPRKPLEPAGFQFPMRPGTATTPSSGKGKGLSVHEEDGEGDSSFGTNGSSPCGGAGGSPCPPTSKLGRSSLKLMSQPFAPASKFINTKRPLAGRAQTSGILSFAR
ncbi:hypothetical protein JCM10212_004663 [Sporobolomyces blumeae]